MSELVEIYKGIHEIEVGGATYSLVPLELGDFAAAQAHVVSTRIKDFMANTSAIPMTDAARALAISEIQCRVPLLVELLDSFEGKLKLLHLSASRGAGKPITFADFKAKLGTIDSDVLWATLTRISGLTAKKKDGEAVPLDTTTTPT